MEVKRAMPPKTFVPRRCSILRNGPLRKKSTRTARAARSHSTRRPCGFVRTTSRWPPFNLGNHRWSLGQWTISRQPFLLSAPNHGSVCGLKMFDTANLV
ncbi:unnamed protein product [Nesidiocoris tenuis]|uniref:Uncharacterized protein n=1 Tax=Nesidiocoris tenuis TaxID=355587 RepID=A0A6H5HN21_9HEMI|nr:unnamed protein product [Nesidiocoris tenuis]